MADLIDRQAVMDSIIDLLEIEWGYKGIREDVQRIFNEAPAVGAVEVVRCKDCKHYKHNGSGYGECPFFDEVKDDEYCSSGERRGENAAD